MTVTLLCGDVLDKLATLSVCCATCGHYHAFAVNGTCTKASSGLARRDRGYWCAWWTGPQGERPSQPTLEASDVH
jgi:hypothetical protein